MMKKLKLMVLLLALIPVVLVAAACGKTDPTENKGVLPTKAQVEDMKAIQTAGIGNATHFRIFGEMKYQASAKGETRTESTSFEVIRNGDTARIVVDNEEVAYFGKHTDPGKPAVAPDKEQEKVGAQFIWDVMDVGGQEFQIMTDDQTKPAEDDIVELKDGGSYTITADDVVTASMVDVPGTGSAAIPAWDGVKTAVKDQDGKWVITLPTTAGVLDNNTILGFDFDGETIGGQFAFVALMITSMAEIMAKEDFKLSDLNDNGMVVTEAGFTTLSLNKATSFVDVTLRLKGTETVEKDVTATYVGTNTMRMDQKATQPTLIFPTKA